MRIFKFLAFFCIVTLLPNLIIGQSISLAKPTQQQINFADWEVGAFIHYGLNPFTDQEHGDGQESPSKFNPTNLDVEQWVLTAKSMGAKYVCLTARHEGGFCLWPSKTTEYTIANSSYKDGKGDIVREFVDACRKHGLIPTLYHTAAFDANATLGKYKGDLKLPLDWMTTWGQAMGEAHRADPGLKKRLIQKQVEQMRELLTNYGPIGFMWSDHWDAKDPNGVWRAVTDLAKELQPEMVFMGPDTWVPGNETGHVVYPMWNAVHTVDGTNNTRPAANSNDMTTENNYGLLEGEVRTGHPLGEFWRVRECTTNNAFSYGGWFWHPDSIMKTYPKKHWEHLDLYYRTVGLGANTIINLPPNTEGVIPKDIADAAKALGDDIRKRFSNPIAEVKTVTKGDIVEVSWKKAREINTIVTMENIVNGQKISKYILEAFVNGKWEKLEPRNKLVGFKPYSNNPGYETIGHKKIDRVKPVITKRIRFRCLESVVKPVEIRSLSVYNCDPIVRNYASKYPYLSGVQTISESAHGGVRRDKDYEGNGIEINGKSFDKGLMICPVGSEKIGYAEFDKTEFKKAKGMKAFIGIEDMTNDNGSCVFIVEAFKYDKWEVIYKSERLTGKDDAVLINVEFPKGTDKIRLTTTDGGDNGSSDHAVWTDAQFVR
ncbi:alpha-L-fucosidase [Mariniflexile sp. AS56]|uniref:alpha-L-fucosidase n=1 Tax=Mariniflexile sp. AS56 TaxID=3063957 RepID=UPI0026F157F0|nr:alpha-L-fucosidase [Mariniflexile sp. AS56]MDO7172518.1 alpha-L-fucosidase [Mariniflexile sp. AS56]